MPIGQIADWDPPPGGNPQTGTVILDVPGWIAILITFGHADEPWGLWVPRSQVTF